MPDIKALLRAGTGMRLAQLSELRHALALTEITEEKPGSAPFKSMRDEREIY